jgi:hypothetical protein
MAISSLTFVSANKKSKIARHVRENTYQGRSMLKVEALSERVMPAITASFTAAGALLRVVGDALDNSIVVSRNAAGTIFVNNGAVAIQGDPNPTVVNTRMIMITGGGGNDSLSLNETNGIMPAASIFGGTGNDFVVGGSQGDFIDGETGNDMIFLGAGDDTFQWNPGDGSDVVEGQGGTDTMVFNGSDLAERFDISDTGSGLPFHRVRLTRDIGAVSMNLNGIETIELNANGGADTITINDQTATDIFTVNVDLGGFGNGDGQADTIIINGTNGDDLAQIASFNGTSIGANVSFFPFVNITSAESASDMLTLNTLGGNDIIDASSLAADLITLTVNAGVGNDTIVGSQATDIFVWNPGDGSDTIDGQAGFDSILFNGSDTAERFDFSPNGNQGQFTGDAGSVAMNFIGVEHFDLTTLGGADTITVNDLTQTELFGINLNLANSAGTGDGEADKVIVNGSNGDDSARLEASGTLISVKGLSPAVTITGAEPANDRLTVNALAGNDTIDAGSLPANLIGLSLNGGTGINVIKTPLFGDGNGDGRVDSADFALFRLVFGVSSAIFDFDGDGVVNAADFAQFRLRFGTSG